MREATPKSKESKEDTLSFEEFNQKVKETVELMRTQDLLDSNYYGVSMRRRKPIRKLQGKHMGDPDYYEADLDAVKAYPEFAKLIAEEQEILASSASKEGIAQYNTIAERAYQRRNEVLGSIKQKLESLLRGYGGGGWFVFEAAEILFNSSQGGRPVDKALEKALLHDQFSSLKSSMKSRAEGEKRAQENALLQERFGLRYREYVKNAEAALKGQKILVELNAAEKRAQERGFGSTEELWSHDIEALRKLKDEVGEGNFRELESMNRTR